LSNLHPSSPEACVLDLLFQETRQSIRGLVRRPALTLAALLTMALGIGANGAVFSVLNSIVLRPLPYAAPHGLVTIWPDHFVAHREIDFLRQNLRTLQDVASLSPGWLMSLTGIEQPTEVDGAGVSGNLFRTLGAAPQLGRTFGDEADRPGGPREVVLSHDLWRTQLGGDPAIVGRSIMLSRESWQVIGVMPRGFHILDSESDLWFPLPMDPTAQYLGRSHYACVWPACARRHGGASQRRVQSDNRAHGSTFRAAARNGQ
jgi:hypothetical protein